MRNIILFVLSCPLSPRNIVYLGPEAFPWASDSDRKYNNQMYTQTAHRFQFCYNEREERELVKYSCGIMK
jgi:hypothetical protein